MKGYSFLHFYGVLNFFMPGGGWGGGPAEYGILYYKISIRPRKLVISTALPQSKTSFVKPEPLGSEQIDVELARSFIVPKIVAVLVTLLS